MTPVVTRAGHSRSSIWIPIESLRSLKGEILELSTTPILLLRHNEWYSARNLIPYSESIHSDTIAQSQRLLGSSRFDLMKTRFLSFHRDSWSRYYSATATYPSVTCRPWCSTKSTKRFRGSRPSQSMLYRVNRAGPRGVVRKISARVKFKQLSCADFVIQQCIRLYSGRYSPRLLEHRARVAIFKTNINLRLHKS